MSMSLLAHDHIKNIKAHLAIESTIPALAIESQSITAASWLDGEYVYFKRSGEILMKETEKKKLTFTKNEKGEVTQFTFGDLTYRGDEDGKSEFVRYYSSGNAYCIFFTASCIYLFDSPVNTLIRGSVGGKGKTSMNTQIETFLEESRSMQEADLKAYEERMAEEARIAREEKEKKFSIKNKEVTKLEIINLNLPEKLGHYATFDFDVKATLNDGSVLSTDNGGFWSDYVVTYVGGDFSDNKIKGSFIKDDKIVITVTSAFDANMKITADVVMLYNQDITFNYTAIGWSRSAGENANSFKIEVKQVKHKVNGSPLNAIQITNVTTGAVVAQIKLGIEQTLNFTCDGGYGGSDDGYGKDGGDGGNITLIKDPSVKSFLLNKSNRGGKAGKGSTSSYDGRTGTQGEFTEQVSAVTLPL